MLFHPFLMYMLVHSRAEQMDRRTETDRRTDPDRDRTDRDRPISVRSRSELFVIFGLGPVRSGLGRSDQKPDY